MMTRAVVSIALAALTVLGTAPFAAGQTIGPVTGRLPTEEPSDASFRVGPVLVRSGVSVQRLGVDNNVFDDAEDPKRDWHAVITPDLTAYMRAGLIRFTMQSAADFTYYRKYTSERGINRALRARTDFLFSRFRPFIGGASVDTRERPNAEIDLRAERSEREVIAGLNFEISPLTSLFGGAARSEFRTASDEIYDGVALAQQLDHRQDAVVAGLRRALTPLTTFEVAARHSRDRFDHLALRNADMTVVETTFTFAPDALFHGELLAGVENFDPNDPRVLAYRGLTLGGRIVWPIFTATQLDLAVDRRLQYSYDEAEAYYIDTGTMLTLTQRVFDNFDVQARGGYRRLAYRESVVPGSDPNDRVITALGGVGYTLRDDSRVAFNYEFTNRDSERRRNRLFDRHRLYASWTQRF